MSSLDYMKPKQPIIIKSWFGGDPKKKSIIMPIPKSICSDYNLQEPTNIILIPKEDGILLRKLEIK
jgi:hypothetical protein